MSSQAVAASDQRSDVVELGAIGAVVYLLCLVSGVSGLIYEVLWMRKLSLVFGVTTYAVTTVLTSFLAGLALGAYVFGRAIQRSRRPLFVYGLLELGIGVSAVVVFVLIGVFEKAYVAAYRGSVGQSGHLTAMRFVAGFVLLLVPTVLMGGTLPVLCRTLVQRLSSVGRNVGLLYALNTLGAAAGCFWAGYVLIGRFGLWRTNLLAAAINVCIAMVALAIAALTARRPPPRRASPLCVAISRCTGAICGSLAAAGAAGRPVRPA